MLFTALVSSAKDKPGATMPWVTYEAENMTTNGTVMGPCYEPYRVETESSGQKCVKLNAKGQYVEFSALSKANSIVIRYSLPDGKQGNGTNATLGVYKNGNLAEQVKVSSRYTWLYGKYPFTNDPSAGEQRNFYDEIRVAGVMFEKGDVIRIQLDGGKADNADYCIIDLADLEIIAPASAAPPNSFSITDVSFAGSGVVEDYTEAFKKCIAAAVSQQKIVWIPPGVYKITGDIILPDNITIQGAGMWHTTLVGDENLYNDANRRVRLKGNGSNIHLADFAIIGKLNYRNDNEPNDGIVGSFGIGSTISGLWIEHTKVGMWIQNSSNLKITGCRMRNTIADGINFCVGMNKSTIENCTARGTGDDCFAFWPAVFEPQQFEPGHNLVNHCTGQLPFLANGAAIYGGDSNAVKNCLFTDISQGSAILISTTFPTENKDVNNSFSGTTVVKNCDIKTSGGFDHEWDWRASVEICVDRRSISGVEISGINIENSLSNGVSVIAKNDGEKQGLLSNTVLKNITISGYGIGAKDKYGLFISTGAHGGLSVKNSNIPVTQNASTNFIINSR